MITRTQIKPNAPVVCSEDGQFATVDHMEGNDTIKLKKDDEGDHHYIPLSWVNRVDDKVHIDRTGDQAMRDWSASPPATDDSQRGNSQRDSSQRDSSQRDSSQRGQVASEGKNREKKQAAFKSTGANGNEHHAR